MDAEVKTSISYEQTNAQKSYSCSQRLGTHTPSDKPKPPTKVTARLGWTSKTFDGDFIGSGDKVILSTFNFALYVYVIASMPLSVRI